MHTYYGLHVHTVQLTVGWAVGLFDMGSGVDVICRNLGNGSFVA